jgi:hypothetical protein
MAWTSNGTSAEFEAGHTPLVNEGRGNDNSVTLNGGLQDAGDRWNAESQQAAMTPHSVLSTYNFARSANGTDGQNMLPNGTYLGSSNGQSADTFDKRLMLGMAGSNDNLP